MKYIQTFVIILGISAATYSQPNAKQVVKNAYDLMQGQTNESVMKMTIVRPKWERSISFHVWSKGKDFSLAVVTDPPKEKGQSFLKRKNEIWNWVPNIQRMIKLPPSMMSQGWMGSDYSNDDILKESSVVDDYDHTITGMETMEGKECYKIKMVPKPDAAVVWGYVIKWISKDSWFQLRSDYYDEDNILVKTELASNIKKMGDREIPTHFEIIPADKPNQKTVVDMQQSIFNKPIEDGFFSQQNMKVVR
jgi:hypothetical protein